MPVVLKLDEFVATASATIGLAGENLVAVATEADRSADASLVAKIICGGGWMLILLATSDDDVLGTLLDTTWTGEEASSARDDDDDLE
mmetsp:Transcript_24016/g.34332  ORF Transcript_24016/g.34332 Transcript_24016/m.34332 type:complete len:88 (+) Transcript_24016:1512-1775(+)